VDLVETITSQIIPRLLLANRMDARELERVADARRPPSIDEVASLASAAVAQDLKGCMRQVEVRLQEGLSIESILLDLVSNTARLLGEQWQDDERSFAEVTLGLGTLHRLLATLRYRVKPPLSHRGLVVLLAAPGEQHTLGIHVLGDLFQHAGWEALVKPNLGEEELIAMVSCEPVVMVGISVSSYALLGAVDRIVPRILQSSLNRDIAVMLGGSLDLSSYAEDMGAIHCANARTALGWLESRARVSL